MDRKEIYMSFEWKYMKKLDRKNSRSCWKIIPAVFLLAVDKFLVHYATMYFKMKDGTKSTFVDLTLNWDRLPLG